MEEEAGASRPKIHRLPQKTVNENELYVSRGVIIVCLALLLVVVVPALWSFNKPATTNVTQVISPQPAQAAEAPPETPDSITVHDDNGQIVGQLTKMPADIDHGGAINTTAKVDQKSGKELMNIISKY